MNVDQSAHEIFCVSAMTSQMYILHYYFDALLTKVYLIYSKLVGFVLFLIVACEDFLVQLEEVTVHV